MLIKNMLRLQILAMLFISTIVLGQETLRLTTYNLLNYNGTQRNDYFETVLEAIQPQIIIVQEISSQTAVDNFATTVLDNEYHTIPFHNGNDSDNHIFFDPYTVQIISADYITTDLRDIAEYKLEIMSSRENVYIYSTHLKASQGTDNEARRLAEVTILRNRLDALPENTNFIFVGDLNLYSSSEQAYQKLLEQVNGTFGHLYDPIDAPGKWHDTASFASIHSQSPRVETLSDGGASGGMDDRFDFILISESLLDNAISNSYMAYGNDGQHFNQSINAGTNNAVDAAVANALYYASDHLPVVMDITFGITPVEGTEKPGTAISFALAQNYPNPFNPSTTIRFQLPVRAGINLEIFDITGKKVVSLANGIFNAGSHQVEWNTLDSKGNLLPSGVYFYQLRSGTFVETKKMFLIR